MTGRRGFSAILSDPKQGRLAVAVILFLLSWLAMMLRAGLDFDGVLDTDVMNFGLAGFRFDLLDHQPHPPGYPGYVVLLKLVHALAPWLDPIELAKWTTRICGAAIPLAAYWACVEIVGSGASARGRGLWAAAISVVHPVLWYYGGDGQSHGAEALLTLVLFAICVRVHRAPDHHKRLKCLGVVALFALAGSVRPTVPALASPLLVWIFWKRPRIDWLLAAIVGVATLVAWYVPLVAASGGFDLYQRAARALVSDMFIANYSVFGERASFRGVAANLGATMWSFVFSIVPLIALGNVARAWSEPWIRVVVAIAVANVVFFTAMFTAEFGYLIGLAALAVLVPATWPQGSIDRPLVLRVGLMLVVCPVLLFAGPATVPIPYSAGAHAPTYPRVVAQAAEQRVYRELMCGAAEGEPTLLISDNYSTTNGRWLSMVCPNVVVGLYLHDFPLNPAMDNWLFFFDDHMDAVPAPIPLEPGPGGHYVAPPVNRVVVSLESTKELVDAMGSIASCAPASFEPYGPEFSMNAWPARCFDKIELGKNVIEIRSSGEPTFGPGFTRP